MTPYEHHLIERGAELTKELEIKIGTRCKRCDSTNITDFGQDDLNNYYLCQDCFASIGVSKCGTYINTKA